MKKNKFSCIPVQLQKLSFKDIIKKYNIEIIYGDIGTVAHTELYQGTWEIYIDEKLHSTCKRFILLHEIGHILLQHNPNKPHFRKGEVDSELELEADHFARLNFENKTINEFVPADNFEDFNFSDLEYIKKIWRNKFYNRDINIKYNTINNQLLTYNPKFDDFNVYVYTDEFCKFKYHWNLRLPQKDGCVVSVYFVTMCNRILYNRIEINTIYKNEKQRLPDTLRYIKFSNSNEFMENKITKNSITTINILKGDFIDLFTEKGFKNTHSILYPNYFNQSVELYLFNKDLSFRCYPLVVLNTGEIQFQISEITFSEPYRGRKIFSNLMELIILFCQENQNRDIVFLKHTKILQDILLQHFNGFFLKSHPDLIGILPEKINYYYDDKI